MSDALTFCLLVPTLNEIDGMRAVMPHVDRSLFKEILVVDGGSTDGTVEYCHQHGLTILKQPNKGLPDAEEYAFKHVKSDALILFTPDGNSKADLLPVLIHKLSEGYDMVIASRYLGGAKSEDDDVMTAFGNWMFTAMINLLFHAKYTDTLVGLRAYRCNAMRIMQLPGMTEATPLRAHYPLMNSWETGASIRAARLKLRVVEIPGDEPKRIGGVRKMRVIQNGLGTLFQIIYDFLFFHPRVNAR